MKLKLNFDIYQRRFKQPLRTSHGIWQIREGIIISLSNGIDFARGEIAPLSWFGSETMSQALEFCQHWGDNISTEDIAKIPDRLPACQFAFESAWLNLTQPQVNIALDNLDFCYLLPAGATALNAWQKIYQQQHNTTFKWKIGVYPLAQEIEILQQLVATLPSQVKLRLDANEGLNLTQAQQLLAVTDNLTAIEFIEQPLARDCLREMIRLSQEYSTPLALDESVASFLQLQQADRQGWQGIFTIKAAIMGFPSRLIEYCQQHSLDIVFSSVLETEIGRDAVLKFARQLNHPRAFGFGVEGFIRGINGTTN
ncbi:o-succinylbenzoate synthase [Waterburya agarophytonicola K14]|uniref:o-succinylbenzoate synthase n=1 Tax=Waterburya agarophytonicola KI4 TaxID=2874699 RepID=A0A964FFI2_9CYAN|nr:o-succinylbenzoate synthase [Waterburya agarophytonicola]MCC0176997.1 o-succinylbenzoate synthase [Waterburya agarophytonicola KI4]